MYQITEIDIHKGVETILCTNIENSAIARTMARLATQEFNKTGVRYKYIVQEEIEASDELCIHCQQPILFLINPFQEWLHENTKLTKCLDGKHCAMAEYKDNPQIVQTALDDEHPWHYDRHHTDPE